MYDMSKMISICETVVGVRVSKRLQFSVISRLKDVMRKFYFTSSFEIKVYLLVNCLVQVMNISSEPYNHIIHRFQSSSEQNERLQNFEHLFLNVVLQLSILTIYFHQLQIAAESRGIVFDIQNAFTKGIG